MRILRIARRVPSCPGGQERHIHELTREQAAAGHAVLLLAAEGDLEGGENWRFERVTGGVGRGPTWLESWRFGRAVRRWVRRHNVECDIVHAHGDYLAAFMAAAVGGDLGKPAVVTCHGSFGSAHPLRDQLRRRAFRRLDHIFTVSRELAERLRDLGVETPITVQHSGTRLDPLRAIERAPSPQPRVVAVGSLVPVKGYSCLLAAVRRLAERWPDLELHVLGDGPERARLEAEADDLTGVRFHGQVGRDEVYRALRGAWVYALTSVDLPRITEGLPTTVVEALAAGVPIVASKVGGVPDVVEHGVNGFLVPQRDPEALAAAIDRLLGDAELRATIGATNERAGRAHDWRTVAAVFTRICEDLAVAG